jgi:hypothetical protein
MRFSIAKLLVAMFAFNVLIGLSFAAPSWIGFPILTLIALVVVPPVIIVGAVNTRGPRQAFFLGCMVAGLPHFIVSLYTGVIMVISYEDWSWADDETAWIMQMCHLGGYFFGLIGGLSGVGAWFMIAGSDVKAVNKEQAVKVDFGMAESSFENESESFRPLARNPK